MFQAQGPPPPYPNNVPLKRIKDDECKQIQFGDQTSPMTTQERLQMLKYLQHKSNNLNEKEQSLLQQLSSHYKSVERVQILPHQNISTSNKIHTFESEVQNENTLQNYTDESLSSKCDDYNTKESYPGQSDLGKYIEITTNY